ncbi:DNA-binding transcriptional MocR family regulator [Myroides gitamensis]|nr:DNA-binding transcriptional MocR family regulator [Myroides gitamensis]
MFYTDFQYSTVKKYKYEIFTTKIERAIQQGHLRAGDALPSVRETKATYQLSTSSVQSGYDYLVFKGLVTSIPRSGYVVAAHIQTTAATKLDLPTIPKDAVFTTKKTLTSQRLTHTERPSFHIAAPASTFIPQQLILKTMQTVIREKGVSLLQYYPNTGSEELQALLIKRAALHGASLQKEELIVTDGALQALYIALASTTVPHDIVAVESPCVFSVLEVLSSLRLRALEIPVRPVHGFDLAYLRKMCQQHAVKAVVLTPNFHNPTGILMRDEQKEELYSLGVQHQIPIIENDIYGDLHFQGERPINIKNFDKKGLVLTFSSYSKTIAPGLRLGWLAAGQYAAQAERLKFSLGRSVSPINQEVIIQLLQMPSYDKHLRIFRQQLERQAMQFLRTFNAYFPSDFTQQAPQGGYSIWGQLPNDVDAKSFYETCQTMGIGFTPGETFSFTDVYKRHFRAIFAQRLTATDLSLIKQLGEELK